MTLQGPLRNALVVTVTWWLVFTFLFLLTWQGDNFDDYFGRGIFILCFVAACALMGVAGAIVNQIIHRHRKIKKLRGHTSYGLTYTIGPVPTGLGEPPRAKGARIDWSTATGEHLALKEWYDRVQESHPEVARAFDAVVEVHMAKPDWPAGKTSLGHGGRTLLDHAFRVSAHILNVAKTYEYVGTLRKNGSVLVAPIDKAYNFDKDDPLLGLVGFCHDIGKLETLRPEPLGKITEVRHDHDRVGALMLARMGEIYELGWELRSILLDSVSFYHRPSDMPLNVTDRARALMQLLRSVDIESSKWEFVNPIEVVDTVGEEKEGSFDRRAVDKICDVLGLPNRINGPKGQTLGYKYQEYVYLNADAFGAALATEFGNDTLASEGGQTQSSILAMVMGSLAKAGLLMTDWMGATTAPDKAYFVVDWYDHRSLEKDNPKYGAPALETWRATIILRSEMVSPGISRMADCRLIPRIEQPTTGQQKGVWSNPIKAAAPTTNSSGQANLQDTLSGPHAEAAQGSTESVDTTPGVSGETGLIEGTANVVSLRSRTKGVEPPAEDAAAVNAASSEAELPRSEATGREAHEVRQEDSLGRVEPFLPPDTTTWTPRPEYVAPSARVVATAVRRHEDRKAKSGTRAKKPPTKRSDGPVTAEEMAAHAVCYFDENRIALTRVPGKNKQPFFVAPIDENMERELAATLRGLRLFGNQEQIRIAKDDSGQEFLAILATPSLAQLELLVEQEATAQER